MRNLIFSGVLAIILGAQAMAGDLVVTVRDQKGTPVNGAIVTLETAAPGDTNQLTTTTQPPPSEVVIDQKGEQFASLTTLVRPGDSVRFRNSDKLLHHVYSFASINPFDILVRPGETTTATLYDKAGLAALGCNVHDDMLTYVYVSDAQFAAKTGEDGSARIVNAPVGGASLSVWHPSIAASGQSVNMEIAIAEQGGEIDVPVKTRRTRRQRNRY